VLDSGHARGRGPARGNGVGDGDGDEGDAGGRSVGGGRESEINGGKIPTKLAGSQRKGPPPAVELVATGDYTTC
jgi:hypothetical protein